MRGLILFALLSLGCLAQGATSEPYPLPGGIPELGVTPLRPTSLEIKKVVEYFKRGNAPVLVDLKLCRRIGQDGPAKHVCLEEEHRDALAQGTQEYLWMSFLVPQDFTNGSVVVRFEQNGIAKQTLEQALSVHDGSMEYRLHPAIPRLSPGAYDISVLLNRDGNLIPLDKTSLHVSRN